MILNDGVTIFLENTVIYQPIVDHALLQVSWHQLHKGSSGCKSFLPPNSSKNCSILQEKVRSSTQNYYPLCCNCSALTFVNNSTWLMLQKSGQLNDIIRGHRVQQELEQYYSEQFSVTSVMFRLDFPRIQWIFLTPFRWFPPLKCLKTSRKS